MKVKDGFILREIAGSSVVMPTGEALVDFNMMLTLNETGVFLWERLVGGTTKEELVNAILCEYDVDEESAKQDITDFLTNLYNGDLLDINE